MRRSRAERTGCVALAAGLLVLSVGCAGWDGTVVPTSPTPAVPETGLEVRIESVRDERVFQTRSADTWKPTLRGGSSEDRGLTSRVVGRRGKPSGQQLGNLLVADGQSVEALVGSAITAGYTRAGYRVLEPGDADYEDALPVSAGIRQLWTRYKPSQGPAVVEFRISVRLQALPDFDVGTTVTCMADSSGVRADRSLYTRVINTGLERFAEAVRARLRGDPRIPRCEGSG